MNKHYIIVVILITILSSSCSKEESPEVKKIIIGVGFGSCSSNDKDGNLWMASGGYLSIRLPDSYSKSDYVSIGNISSLSVYDSTKLIVGGSEGFAYKKNGEWYITLNDYWTGDDDPNVYCNANSMYVDRQNDFLIIKDDTTIILDKDGVDFPDCEVNKVIVNSKNEIILATAGMGIIKYREGSWVVYDTIKFIEDMVVENDIIYFVHPGLSGVHLLNNNDYSKIIPPDSINGATTMWSICIDMEGDIWCGSSSPNYNGALFEYNTTTKYWSSLQAEYGNAHDTFQISRIAVDKNNNIWFSQGYRTSCIYNPDGIKY